MAKKVLRKFYKGCDIRSSPIEGAQIKGPEKWKVQLNITFPDGTTLEEFGPSLRYLTQIEAHTAGFQHGRGLIDKLIRNHSPHIPSN
jgi:hypothetical protein